MTLSHCYTALDNHCSKQSFLCSFWIFYTCLKNFANMRYVQLEARKRGTFLLYFLLYETLKSLMSYAFKQNVCSSIIRWNSMKWVKFTLEVKTEKSTLRRNPGKRVLLQILLKIQLEDKGQFSGILIWKLRPLFCQCNLQQTFSWFRFDCLSLDCQCQFNWDNISTQRSNFQKINLSRFKLYFPKLQRMAHFSVWYVFHYF